MNRRGFVKGSLALAGAAALVKIGMAEEETKKIDKKCMVIYFSWSGNTRFAAETIAKKTGAGPSAIAVKKSDANLDFPRRQVHDL